MVAFTITLETDGTSETLSHHGSLQEALRSVDIYNNSSQRKGEYTREENPNLVIWRGDDEQPYATIQYTNF